MTRKSPRRREFERQKALKEMFVRAGVWDIVENIDLPDNFDSKYAPCASTVEQYEGFTDELHAEFDKEMMPLVKEIYTGRDFYHESHWRYIAYLLDFKKRHNLPI